MPRAKVNLSIEVRDGSSSGELKRVSVSIEGDRALFETSDFCAREGAIPSLCTLLESDIKRSLLSYIESGKAFMRAGRNRTGRVTQREGDSATRGSAV